MILSEKTFRSLLSVDDFTFGKYTHSICKRKFPAILHEKTTEGILVFRVMWNGRTGIICGYDQHL